MNEAVKIVDVFIPITPGRKLRVAALLTQALPGLILVLAAIDSPRETIGAALLSAFSFVAGLFIIYSSVKEFKFPGVGKKPGTDMIAVLSGFLLIAEGSKMFDAVKEFQPAHLYFLAGAIFIFKGVMLPDKELRRGFLISENLIVFKGAPLSRKIKMERTGLENIYNSGNTINFKYESGSIQTVQVSNAENLPALAAELKNTILS